MFFFIDIKHENDPDCLYNITISSITYLELRKEKLYSRFENS